MKSFELQLYRDGVWKTDSIYDDRGLAELEARRLDESPRYGHVRVIEEVYDEKTNRTALRTIFRGSKFHELNEKKLEETRQAKAKLARAQYGKKKTPPIRNRKRQPKPKSDPNVVMILLYLSGIVLFGLGAMFTLQHFGGGL